MTSAAWMVSQDFELHELFTLYLITLSYLANVVVDFLVLVTKQRKCFDHTRLVCYVLLICGLICIAKENTLFDCGNLFLITLSCVLTIFADYLVFLTNQTRFFYEFGCLCYGLLTCGLIYVQKPNVFFDWLAVLFDDYLIQFIIVAISIFVSYNIHLNAFQLCIMP